MLPSIDLSNAIQLSSEFQNRLRPFLSSLMQSAFSVDVMGYQGNQYNKALSIQHIAFVLFLMAFEMSEDSNLERDDSYYYEKYNLKMLSNYLSCLGVRDDVIKELVSQSAETGIGLMIIESATNPFTIF